MVIAQNEEEILHPEEYWVNGAGAHRLAQSDPQSLQQSEADLRATLEMADQQLDHTIFIVGWKVDEATGVPVWIARNSYGDGWGMNGDFYVRMGHDDFGIESEISAYDVEYLL